MVETELLNLAIRYLVCALFAFSSGLIVAILGLMRSEIEGLTENLPLRGVHITSYSLDAATNSICLLLQFPFGKRLYAKCCFRCDRCVQSLFVKALNIKISSKTVIKGGKMNNSENETTTTSGSGVEMEMSI